MAPIKGPGKWLACAIERPIGKRLDLLDKMVGWWNSATDNGWATLGHRTLGIDPEEGQLIGTTGRLFVGLAPTNSDNVTVKLRRRAGQGRTKVEICAHRRGQRAESLIDQIVDPDKKEAWSWDFAKLEDAIVTVHLDGRSAANRFSYELELIAKPKRWDLGPVTGFADLHVHQAAELGTGGNSYWGSHTGNRSAALPRCGWVASFGDVLTSKQPDLASLHAVPLNIDVGEGEYRHGWGDPRFTAWPYWNDIAHQQVHADRLLEAHRQGLNLVVVSAVNNETLCYGLKGLYPRAGDHMGCRDMENIKRQVEAFVQFDEDHDWYEIAVDPWHARKIIHEGKLAAVVSLEASNLLPVGEGDYIAQLDELRASGLRSLQPVHETDSRFAGAAPHRGVFEAMQKIKFPFRNLNPTQGFRFDENGKNAVGLTQDGTVLLREMIKRGMLVDVSHMSERATRDTFALFSKDLSCPYYESHSRFKAPVPDEFAVVLQEFITTEEQIDMLNQVGGMIGVRTGPNPMLNLNKIPGQAASTVANNCAGSSRSYAQLIEYGSRRGVSMAFGSDFNGNTNQVAPRFGPEACALAPDASRARQSANQGNAPGNDPFHTAGLAHMGSLPALLEDLERLGTPGAEGLASSAESFLKMWEQVYEDACRGAALGTLRFTECTSQVDCPDDLYCPNGIGSRKCKPKNPDGQTCTAAHQCQGGACNVVCYTPNSKRIGQSCNVNGECRDSKCSAELWGTVNGKCVCDSDSDCSSGQFCYEGFADIGTNECRSKLADGQLCDQGRKCQSGNCKVSCYTPNSKNMGQSCNINAECKQGKCSAELLGLVNGKCVCEDDGDCTKGYCDKGTLSIGTNSCKSLKKLEEGCSRGAQCASGCCKLNWGKVQCRPADKCN